MVDFIKNISLGVAKGVANSQQLPITTASQMRGFFVQFPQTAKLFGLILEKGRASTAVLYASSGHWAAYTYPQWCSWLGIKSSSTLKQHLDRLEAAALIDRQRSHHNGSRVVSFIRPSATGLALSKSRSSDWKHFGTKPPSQKTEDSLETVFASAYRGFKGTPLVVLAKAEAKALKDIAAQLPDQSSAIIDRCVRDWTTFCAHVAKAHGFPVDKTPEQPSAKFIRAHLQAACDFVAESTPKQPKPAIPMKQVANPQPEPTVQLIAQEEEKPMTKEELLALLNEDEKPITSAAILGFDASSD